jgi:Recombination endonuclease VII
MTTFIERHGYGVQYPVPGYNLAGLTCEIEGCAQKKHEQRLAFLYQALDDLVFFEQIPYAQQRTLYPLGREGEWDRIVTEIANSHSALNAPYKRLLIEHCHNHLWVRGISCESCNYALSCLDSGKPIPLGSRLPAIYGISVTVPDYEKFKLNCPECAGMPKPERRFVDSSYLRPRKS